MKRFLIAILVIFLTHTSIAKPIKIRLKLNWKYQFEFAGYIAAKEKGFYKKAGLDVKIIEYDKGNTIDDVLKGKADFGVADSEIFTYILKRKPVVLLANFFKKSPLVLAVKPSILFPKDLNNKVLLCGATDITLTSVGLLIKKFHIHFKKIIKKKGAYTIRPFIEGKVDAIPIYITNQTYLLNEAGVAYNIIDPSNYGIFAYSGNLFTSRKFLKNHPNVVKKFVQASIEGWQYALSHKKEIAKIIFTKYSSRKSLRALLFEANMLEDVIMPDVFTIGSINKEIVREIVSKFAKILNVEPPKNLSDYIKTAPKLELFTKEELSFIRNHPVITYCIRPHFEPFEFLDKHGKPKGISINILKKISDITHLKFKYIKTQNLEESLESFKKGKCFLLPLIGNRKLLKNQALFSNPYAEEKLFIFSKSNIGLVNSLCTLKNKIFLQVKNTYPILAIKQLCPQITIKELNTYNDVFKNLEKNSYYFSLSSSLIATYYIKKNHLKNIKIVGSTNRYVEISMAINKRVPTLVSIINKSLSKIGKKGVEEIISYQLAKQTKEMYQKFILHIVLFSLGAMSVFFLIALTYYKKNQELSKTKKRLEESLKNFETIMENSIQMVLLYKSDGSYFEVNETALNTLNYTKEELKNKSIQSILLPNETEKIEKNTKNGRIFELNFVKKDNTVLNTLAKATKIKIKNEDVILITAVDITPIKKLQEQLNELNKQLHRKVREETEKNLKKDRMIMHQSKAAAVGDIMMMIAHQWRQPLNAISATVNNLLISIQMGNIDENTFTEKLNNILDYVKHLSETIDDFRNFFRSETTKEPTNIDELIKNLLRIINDHFASKNIEIKTELNCNCVIELYGNELKHAILNILNNSRDVLMERNIKYPVITIKTYMKNEKAIIEIEDNGGGIDERIINHIFDAYFTTKGKKGTGLGLYICKLIVEEHLKGSIEVYNSKDGAVFRIILPIK